MADIFAAHGHGADLYDCTEPFCMEAKMAIIEALQVLQEAANQEGGQ